MKFIEFTQAYKRGYSEKFCLNIENILYFSSFKFSVPNNNYENCNSIITTLGGEEGSQDYYVQETYQQIKDLLKNA